MGLNHTSILQLDDDFQGGMGLDLGTGASVGAVQRLENFWKSIVRVHWDTFINKLLNIFSYNGKYIPI